MKNKMDASYTFSLAHYQIITLAHFFIILPFYREVPEDHQSDGDGDKDGNKYDPLDLGIGSWSFCYFPRGCLNEINDGDGPQYHPYDAEYSF